MGFAYNFIFILKNRDMKRTYKIQFENQAKI